MRLFEKLEQYERDGRIPMHMPGHKRNCGIFSVESPYKIDITEIEGFDDYQEPQEILLESMQWAAEIYGTRQTHYLVNGSTCGILAAISAAVGKKGTLLTARNCHKSVYHAIELLDITPVYIYPDITGEMWISGVISAADVEKELKNNPECSAVILTSPTYEGVVSDVRAIAQVVHRYGKILIVDEAHGAHFPFSDAFPQSAISCGADLVIHSLHKTLPSYTQTALLHVCSDRVDVHKIKKYLGIYQTSSPSYVFMAGMEHCIAYMSGEGKAAMQDYYENLTALRKKLSQIDGIGILEKNEDMTDYDPSKLVLHTYGKLTGSRIAKLLRQDYRIEPEMTADNYVILMTSLCDKKEWYDQIIEAAQKIGRMAQMQPDSAETKLPCFRAVVEQIPSVAAEKVTEPVRISLAEDRISGEMAYVYPPGIPILMPGERITAEVLAIMKNYRQCGLQIKGIQDKSGEIIQCIK
jgi:arginine/lysine/ornithine decarboxylase